MMKIYTISYLKKIWQNRFAIINGVKNKLFASKELKQIASQRTITCLNCPWNSANTRRAGQPEEVINRYDLPFNHCVECGCSIAFKPYSEDAECPKGFWKQ